MNRLDVVAQGIERGVEVGSDSTSSRVDEVTALGIRRGQKGPCTNGHSGRGCAVNLLEPVHPQAELWAAALDTQQTDYQREHMMACMRTNSCRPEAVYVKPVGHVISAHFINDTSIGGSSNAHVSSYLCTTILLKSIVSRIIA